MTAPKQMATNSTMESISVYLTWLHSIRESVKSKSATQLRASVAATKSGAWANSTPSSKWRRERWAPASCKYSRIWTRYSGADEILISRSGKSKRTG